MTLEARPTVFDNPASVPAPPPGRYSHVARIDLGERTLLVLSGQVAVDEHGDLVGPDDMAEQTRCVLETIGKILSAHGAGFEHIVNIRSYLTDLSRIAEYGQARREFLSDPMPTSTTVGVSGLFIEGALLEVEVTAVV